jgi:hypothetical protein
VTDIDFEKTEEMVVPIKLFPLLDLYIKKRLNNKYSEYDKNGLLINLELLKANVISVINTIEDKKNKNIELELLLTFETLVDMFMNLEEYRNKICNLFRIEP